MFTDLKESTVYVEIDGIPSNEASVKQLAEAIELLAKEMREKSKSLLRDDEQSEASSEGEESFPQPEVLQLSADEQLSIHLQRPETHATARNEWSTIQAALKKNSECMHALKAHEDMGAELTIVEVETDDDGKIIAVEFENVADNLNIKAQEQALAALMEDGVTVDAYVQDRLSPFDKAADKQAAEKWMRELLHRPDGVSGLNYIEADMLMWIHGGGQLISHDRLQQQAERTPELWEGTVTWYHADALKEVKDSGRARGGARDGGGAYQYWDRAHCRDRVRGGRASRLRVQIA